MKQITCPKCFVKYDHPEGLAACTNPSCERNGIQFKEKEAERVNGQPSCPACQAPLSARFCPHCGFERSAVGDWAEMLAISMVGASGCGKSNYLTVLINSIKHEMGKVYGSSLYPLGGDNTIEAYNRQYYQPLFVEGQCVASTQQEDLDPLIYSLVFPEGARRGRTCNLTFYDACGQDFDSLHIMEHTTRSILSSKGILFLIDPTQFQPVKERRRAQGKKVCEVDPAHILARTVNLIRSSSGQNDIRQKIQIPIAVCITKLDLIRPVLDPSSFVRYPSRHLRKPAFDPVDFESTNLEIQSVIENWAGTELLNQLESQFATVGFFGFSALGGEPNDKNQVQRITPHRVMDPLLWLLWKNDMVPLGRIQ